MTKFNTKVLFLLAGATVVLCGLAGLFCAGMVVGARSTSNVSSLPALLHADSATGGKSVSIATGRIDDDVEGMFVLDHLTGNLFCLIINPRTATEAGLYQVNVTSQLGIDKLGDLDFVMATGFNAFGTAGRANNLRPAQCVCYIVEGNSGKAVGYSLFFNRTTLQQGGAQAGELSLVWQGSVRPDNARRN